MAREQGPKGLKTRGGFPEGEQATSPSSPTLSRIRTGERNLLWLS